MQQCLGTGLFWMIDIEMQLASETTTGITAI